jgi:hypothetical protein
MNEVFTRIQDYWENYGFEILSVSCLIIIIILCIYNFTFKNESGTYNEMLFLHRKKYRNKNIYNNNNNNNNNQFEYIQHTPNDSKLELQTKFLLEDIFKVPFYKIRPDFLRNDVTGYNLEIDLYNDDLKLAVEVQGDQHYKFIPFFHRNKEAFMMQRYRDEMKKQKCMNRGITLIEIPYKVGEKGLKKYLLTQLRLNEYLI